MLIMRMFLVKQINAQINGNAEEDANYVPIRNYIRLYKQKQQSLSKALMASQKKTTQKKPAKPSVALILRRWYDFCHPRVTAAGPTGLLDDGIAGADKIAAAFAGGIGG